MGISVVAHRGDSEAARENTLEAFSRAVEADVDLIELDVRTTASGHSIVLHDATTLRLWGRPSEVARMTLDEVQAILRPHLRSGEKRITIDDIQKATAEHYGMKQADLLSERRNRAVARPRQAAMWLAKQLTTRSLPDIGRRFGGRDHTTVLHAVRRIEALRAEDSALNQDLETITRKLRG